MPRAAAVAAGFDASNPAAAGKVRDGTVIVVPLAVSLRLVTPAFHAAEEPGVQSKLAMSESVLRVKPAAGGVEGPGCTRKAACCAAINEMEPAPEAGRSKASSSASQKNSAGVLVAERRRP